MNPEGNGTRAGKSPEHKLWLARGACFLQIGCAAQLSVYEAVHMMEQGISGTMTGTLIAIQNGLIILTSPLWGWVADRYRFYRRLISIGTIGISFTLAWFAFADSTVDFLIYAILRGVLISSMMGVMPALALANLPAESQGKGYGSYRAFGSIGFMTGTMILPFLLPSISAIILLAAVLLPISLYFVFGLERPPLRTPSEEAAFRGKLPKLLYWFLAANFLVSLTDPAINGFYNSFSRSLGAPLEWIGFISGINGFIGFIFLPLMGRWVDFRGPRLILILGFAAQGFRLLTASFITAPEWLWVPQLFHTFGWAGREVATIVFVTMIVGPAKRATAISLAVSTKMGGLMVGAFLMGSLSDMYGYPIMFRIIAALAGCSLIFLLYVLRHGEIKNRVG